MFLELLRIDGLLAKDDFSKSNILIKAMDGWKIALKLVVNDNSWGLRRTEINYYQIYFHLKDEEIK